MIINLKKYLIVFLIAICFFNFDEINAKDYLVYDNTSNSYINSNYNKVFFGFNYPNNKYSKYFKPNSKMVVIYNDEVINYYPNEKKEHYFFNENKKRNGKAITNAQNEKIEFENIKFIYQNTEKYQKIKCDKNGDYLTSTFNVHGCMMTNFVMVNNSEKKKKANINSLLKNGYDCHFDYNKAVKDFGYSQYQLIDLKGKYTSDLSYKFENIERVVDNNKDTFTIKEYMLSNKMPLMVWMIPKKENKLNKGHLITIYKYEKIGKKEKYYFYDTYNKNEPSRDLNDFVKRWKIANIHALKK
ncbi:hypothetical protein OKW23_001395 [Bacilli bacterium PM5-9]|nr:hypothetical protein [Bacilli bacterium PM5-9]